MSAATAIGSVSEALQRTLIERMTVDPAVPVTVLAPDEPGGARRINLFLYGLDESPFLRNLDWQVRPGSRQLVPPPLSLTLSYMLTAYAPADQQTGDSAAHQLLGAAMRVFYEQPVVPREMLGTDLRNAPEEIRVYHVGRSLAEATQLWTAVARPYRTSAFYEVSVVQIDPRRTAVEVPVRVNTVVVAPPTSSFRPPVVSAMSVTGTRLHFVGEHLRGQRATVSMAAHTLLDDEPLDADAFDAPLPASLDDGLYGVRVDVAGLFRRTFLCERP